MNAGASFGNVKTDFNVAPVSEEAHITTTNLTFGLASPGFAGSDTESPSGFIGGGQIGYNWQYSPLIVVGLETDFQGALERDHNTPTSNFIAIPNGTLTAGALPGSTVLDYQTKIEWFGTVRGRIGYVWGNSEVLSYLTGGLAYCKVSVAGTFSISLVQFAIVDLPVETPFTPSIPSGAFGHSQVKTGWVVGYGTKGHLPLMPGNWTWKIEGLYMDLGTIDTATPGFSLSAGTASVGASTTGGGATTHTHFTDGILRGGLNCQFH